MTNDDGVEKLRCSARTHAKMTHERRYIRHRCTDPRCLDVIAAKLRDQIVIHVFDLWTPRGLPIRMTNEFEYNLRKMR